jgi:hypothetical protein
MTDISTGVRIYFSKMGFPLLTVSSTECSLTFETALFSLGCKDLSCSGLPLYCPFSHR